MGEQKRTMSGHTRMDRSVDTQGTPSVKKRGEGNEGSQSNKTVKDDLGERLTTWSSLSSFQISQFYSSQLDSIYWLNEKGVSGRNRKRKRQVEWKCLLVSPSSNVC
jgi:hypothetical protein